jgi:hypothetical protein
VIEALDPYSSGITLNQEIRVLEDPVGDKYLFWAISEEQGTFKTWIKSVILAPFVHTTSSTKPHGVNWRLVQ